MSETGSVETQKRNKLSEHEYFHLACLVSKLDDQIRQLQTRLEHVEQVCLSEETDAKMAQAANFVTVTQLKITSCLVTLNDIVRFTGSVEARAQESPAAKTGRPPPNTPTPQKKLCS